MMNEHKGAAQPNLSSSWSGINGIPARDSSRSTSHVHTAENVHTPENVHTTENWSQIAAQINTWPKTQSTMHLVTY